MTKLEDNIKSMSFGATLVEGLSVTIRCPECGSGNAINITDICGKEIIECLGHYDDGSGCIETFVAFWQMSTTVSTHRLEPRP